MFAKVSAGPGGNSPSAQPATPKLHTAPSSADRPNSLIKALALENTLRPVRSRGHHDRFWVCAKHVPHRDWARRDCATIRINKVRIASTSGRKAWAADLQDPMAGAWQSDAVGHPPTPPLVAASASKAFSHLRSEGAFGSQSWESHDFNVWSLLWPVMKAHVIYPVATKGATALESSQVAKPHASVSGHRG